MDEAELEIIAGIERDLDDMKPGRVVSQKAGMADTNTVIQRAKASSHRE